jgi:RNA polymerase sigma-70 factor, ECF subfamily
MSCGCDKAGFVARDKALTRLVHDLRIALARVARGEGLPPEDAFDAVQEAFLTLLRLPEADAVAGDLEQSRKLLITITRNIARNRRRLHANARPHDDRPLELLPDGEATSEELLAAVEDQVHLAGCLNSLSEAQRAVVTLRMLDEVPGEDVARELGITAGHVAVLLHRAKANLLACMVASRGPQV